MEVAAVSDELVEVEHVVGLCRRRRWMMMVPGDDQDTFL